jgi:hypothetical protein
MYRLLVIPLPAISKHMQKLAKYATTPVDVTEFEKVLNAAVTATPADVITAWPMDQAVCLLVRDK